MVEAEGGLTVRTSDSAIGILPDDISAALAPFGQAEGALTRIM